MNYLDKAGLMRLWDKITAKLNNKANTTDIPTKVSDLTNDSGYTKSSQISTFVICTSEEYEALAKDNNTVYLITD